ncbi:MAG: hypothetical protein GX791_02625 [Synergistaceae bacterium]|nr:hypothetical protein [Synergistaceae bacterium]
MKNTCKLLILFLACFLLSVESAAAQRTADLPSEPEIIRISDEVQVLRFYGAKGTRSESRHHYLEIEGKRIPDVFSKLVYKDLSFTFASRHYLWGDDGYFRSGDSPIPHSPSPAPTEQLEKGWYEGRKKLVGTPENWVYGEWKDGGIFAAPEKLSEAADSLKLPILPRDTSGIPLILDAEDTKPAKGKKDEENNEGLSEDALKKKK